MSLSMLGLLVGLFGVPVVLLWLGHRLRRHSPRRRAVFWGATIGYGLGVLLMLVAIHYPPVLWEGADWRTVLVHWGMVIGAVVGATIGTIMGKST